jgi:GNAT superfamily N-acetyltransferase
VELVILQPHHMSDLMKLKAAAQWNQTEDDWLRMMRIEPRGCFGLSSEGQIVASATAIRYGEPLTWIGMVLTLPEVRGQGLARRLTQHAISFARGTQAIRLDASDMGKPLYASLGFIEECGIERWVREPAPAGGRDLPAANVDSNFDREVFGADRSALLADLARCESAGVNGAYAFARPGSRYTFFGPCVAQDPSDARTLLEWFLARHGTKTTCMDLFPHHHEAVTLAREHGFAPLRHLTRMVLRPVMPALPDARVYAVAGFEFG